METAIRYLHAKGGKAAQALTERYGSAVSGIRSKGLWDVGGEVLGRNRD